MAGVFEPLFEMIADMIYQLIKVSIEAMSRTIVMLVLYAGLLLAWGLAGIFSPTQAWINENVGLIQWYLIGTPIMIVLVFVFGLTSAILLYITGNWD